MNRRFLLTSRASLAAALADLADYQVDTAHPHELVLRPFENKIDAAKRSVLHIMLRALAAHTGHSVKELKDWMAFDGEWPMVDKAWRGKVRRSRKLTEDLTQDETKELIAAVESICASEGVSWGRADNWTDPDTAEGYVA